MWIWFTDNGFWILVAVIVGLIVFLALKRWAGSLIRKVVPKQLHEQLDGILIAVTWAVIAIGGLLIALSITAVIISTLGGDITPVLASMADWLLDHGVRIVIIIGLSYLFSRAVKAVLPYFIQRSMKPRSRSRRAKEELMKRADTLSRILVQGISVIIGLIAVFMILSELDIDVTAALAGLGIVGLAVGFGAQYLVRDLIAGFFVFLENHYNVGDVIQVGEIWGIVEEMSLRRTIARDLDGARHVIPNGEIRVLSNLTQDMSRVNLNIGVAYKEDVDRVMSLMRQTWQLMADDPRWGAYFK
ncbi:MAG: mechanosensitive ion channel family protein, partial [Candidatus Thorarchaeota archaeon]